MNYQLSMNVNYRAHMCIHHPHMLICQKIRPRSAGLVPMSDVCAKRLSFTRAINYPNKIKNVGYMYTQQTPRGDWNISLDRMHCISICHAHSKHIIPSPFPYIHTWLDTSRPINFIQMSVRRGKQTHLISLVILWVYTHMSRCFDIPVGLCFRCCAICLLPPAMHITVMPIGRGAISCNTCLETVMSYYTKKSA